MTASHPEPGPAAAAPALVEPLLRLNVADTVAVAMRALTAGDAVPGPDGREVLLRDDVPAGHKVALASVPDGGPVVKFGVHIGTATRDIARGDHVHVHNLESERMRGDRD